MSYDVSEGGCVISDCLVFCRGVFTPLACKDRNERILAIGKKVGESDFDIVLFQEVCVCLLLSSLLLLYHNDDSSTDILLLVILLYQNELKKAKD